MEPSYESGDLLLNNGEYDSIQKGDVVLYIDEGGTSVHHRIIEVDKSREDPYLIRGDNNQASDGWYSEDDIKSKLIVQIFNVKQLC